MLFVMVIMEVLYCSRLLKIIVTNLSITTICMATLHNHVLNTSQEYQILCYVKLQRNMIMCLKAVWKSMNERWWKSHL